MPYVDGFVVAVPKSKVADYKKLARKHGKVWREHGALAYVECLGDDVLYGKHTSFPRAVKAKDSETVVFSWVIYKSRSHRDAVLKRAMADPRMRMDMSKMPFDGKAHDLWRVQDVPSYVAQPAFLAAPRGKRATNRASVQISTASHCVCPKSRSSLA